MGDLHDVYIAATAITHRLMLLTANIRDFSRIEGLLVEDWKKF